MRYLLDTHVLVWLDNNPDKLSKKAADLISNGANDLYISIASIWEIQIKVQLGKLQLRTTLSELIISQREDNNIRVLLADVPHVLAVDKLPFHHKDPFDRLLIAQANVESATIISNDPVIAKYSVAVVW